MNQKTHKQQHHGNEHEHKKASGHEKSPAKRGPHRDWRFWTVIAMLVAIVLYVFSLDETLGPEGEEMPAAVAVDAAP
jgi:hypothetical protein